MGFENQNGHLVNILPLTSSLSGSGNLEFQARNKPDPGPNSGIFALKFKGLNSLHLMESFDRWDFLWPLYIPRTSNGMVSLSKHSSLRMFSSYEVNKHRSKKNRETLTRFTKHLINE